MTLEQADIQAIVDGVGTHLEAQLHDEFREAIGGLREEILDMCKIRHDALNLVVAPLSAKVDTLWDMTREQGGIIKASRWWVGIILGGLAFAIATIAANAENIARAAAQWVATH